MENNLKKQRGARLKQLRLMLGLTHADFAKNIGLNINRIHSWEYAKAGGLTSRGALIVVEKIEELGVMCSYNWLYNGQGSLPMYKSHGNLLLNEDQASPGNAPGIEDEIILYQQNNPSAIILHIEDNLMYPNFFAGDIIGGTPHHGDDLATVIQDMKYFIIKTEEGKTKCREVSGGNEKGTFNVKPSNFQSETSASEIQHNIRLESVAPVQRLWR